MSKTDALTEAIQAPVAVAPRVDNRRHQRYSAGTEVLVYCQDEDGLPYDSRAIVRDISARGFGMEIDTSFPMSTVVTVRTRQRSLRCAVRHIQELPNSFLVGLDVLSSSDDTPLAKSLEELSSALAAAFAEYEKGS